MAAGTAKQNFLLFLFPPFHTEECSFTATQKCSAVWRHVHSWAKKEKKIAPNPKWLNNKLFIVDFTTIYWSGN